MLDEEAVLQRIMESGAFDALRKKLITQLKQNVRFPFVLSVAVIFWWN